MTRKSYISQFSFVIRSEGISNILYWKWFREGMIIIFNGEIIVANNDTVPG